MTLLNIKADYTMLMIMIKGDDLRNCNEMDGVDCSMSCVSDGKGVSG